MLSNLFTATILTLLFVAHGNAPINRDICVVGGGAAGMATAVFAKDNGYTVAVIEKKSFVGGHCKTTNFVPVLPGGEDFVDLGVQLFPDTAKVTLSTLFPFHIDTVQLVKRFAGNDAVIYNDFSALGGGTRYIADLTHSLFLNVTGAPPPGPPGAFGSALFGLFSLLASQYPWISSPGFPDPLPAELLVTMKDWLGVHPEFLVLVPFIQQLTDNLGRYDEILAVYALAIVSPVVLNFFITADTAFHVKGGCSEIYQGMTDYLGEENVVLDSLVTAVNRKVNGKVQLRGKNTHTDREFKYFCDDVVIAFPQTAGNLQDWDLDAQEATIFGQTGTRNYWWGTADVTAPAAVHIDDGFSITIRNVTDPFQTPPYPSLILLNRGNTNQQPAAWYAASGNQPLSDSAITTVINDNVATLTGLPGLNPFTFTMTDFNFHQYQPFVTNVTALSSSPTLYTQIANLQGHRHTYHVGALLGYAGTYIVWENSYNLVQTFFPA